MSPNRREVKRELLLFFEPSHHRQVPSSAEVINGVIIRKARAHYVPLSLGSMLAASLQGKLRVSVVRSYVNSCVGWKMERPIMPSGCPHSSQRQPHAHTFNYKQLHTLTDPFSHTVFLIPVTHTTPPGASVPSSPHLQMTLSNNCMDCMMFSSWTEKSVACESSHDHLLLNYKKQHKLWSENG